MEYDWKWIISNRNLPRDMRILIWKTYLEKIHEDIRLRKLKYKPVMDELIYETKYIKFILDTSSRYHDWERVDPYYPEEIIRWRIGYNIIVKAWMIFIHNWSNVRRYKKFYVRVCDSGVLPIPCQY